MKHVYLFIGFYFALISSLWAQFCPEGTYCPSLKKEQIRTLTTPDQNFTRTLTVSGCGVQYATSHVVLGKRYMNSNAANQPATLSFQQLPCAGNLIIEKAYLYWMIERGQAVGSSSLSFTNPNNQTQTVNGTMIGSYRQGRCWACDYTEHYRADVTAHFTGNGNYKVSGLPQNLICTDGDTDGIVLIVVYKDRSAQEEGTFVLYDGIMLSNSQTFSQTVSDFNVCQTPMASEGFAVIGDFQDNAPGPWSVNMNGTSYPVTPRFFNVEKHPLNLQTGNTSTTIRVTGNTDCFSWIATGVYYKTACTTCNPPQNGTLAQNATICEGQPAPTLTLTGQNGSIVRWEASTDGGNSWTSIPHTNASYTPTNLTRTTRFRVIISTNECPNVNSNAITITLQQGGNGGTLTPENTEICPNDQAPLLTLSGQNGTVSRWERSENCTGSWLTVSHTQTTYQPPNVVSETCFRVQVTGVNCPTPPSNIARIRIRQGVQTGSVSPVTICSGNTATLTLAGHSGNVVRWESADQCNFQGAWNVIGNTFPTLTTPNLTAPVCYRAWVSDGVCPPAPSQGGMVSIVPQAVGGNLNGTATVCMGGTPAPIRLTGQTGTVVRWESSTNCPSFANPQTINFTGTNYQPTPINTTTCFRAVVQNQPCPLTFSDVWTINIRPAGDAGILTQSQTVCAGNAPNPIQLTGNTKPIVRWQSSVNQGQSWTNITHTSSVYNPPNIQVPTRFRVEVADSFCGSIFSNFITIATDTPAVRGSVVNAQTVCSGENAILTLTGHQGNIQNWESSSDNGVTWQSIAHTAISYTAQNITIRTAFRVKIRRGVCPPVVSESAVVSVVQPPVAGTLSEAVTICAPPNNHTLTLSGSSGTVAFWEQKEVGNNDWVMISHTGTTLPINNLARTTEYRVVVQNAPCPNVRSNVVTITVLSDTTTGTISPSQTVCEGGTIQPLTLQLNNGNANILRWEMSTDNGNTWTTINHTLTSYTPTWVLGSRLFRVVWDNGICPPRTTTPATVSGIRLENNGRLTGNPGVCMGGSTTITLSNYMGTILRWEQSTDNEQSWQTINHTASNYSPQNLTQNTAYRVIIGLTGCPNSVTDPIRITILPNAQAGTISGNNEVCFGTPIPELTLSGHTAGIIRWESSRSCPDFVTFTEIPVTTATYRPLNLTATSCFRAVVQLGNCPPVFSPPFTIRVFQPSQAGTIYGNNAVCKGTTVTLNLLGSSGNILRWERSADNFATFSTISNATNTLITPVLNENSCYRAVTQNGICPEVVSPPFCIAVGDSAKGGILSENKTICFGENAGNLSLSQQVGNIIAWERSENQFQTIQNIALTSPSYTLPNIINNTCFRVRVGNGSCPFTYSNPVCVTVIPASNGGQITGENNICRLTPTVSLTLNGFFGNIQYWERSTDDFNTFSTINSISANFTANEVTSRTCFRAKVQNDQCGSVYSNIHCVNVVQPTIAGTLSGTKNVCINQVQGIISLSGQTGSILFWEKSYDNFQTAQRINHTLASYSFQNLTQNVCYRAIIQNSICPAETTNTHCITVETLPIGGNVRESQTVCTGIRPKELILSQYEGQIIRWESAENPIFTNPQTISHTAATYQPNDLTRNTCFRAVVEKGICGTATSQPVCITIEQSPNPGRVIGTDTVCLASNSGWLNFVDYEGAIIRWERSSDDFTTVEVIPNTNPTYYYANLTETTSFRVVTKRGVCQAVYSLPAKITVVQPQISLTVTPIRCRDENNGQISAQITGSIAPYIKLWTKDQINIGMDTFIKDLSGGFYCLYVKDGIGCEEMKCVRIDNPPTFTVSVSEKKYLRCYGSKDGQIKLAVSGGVLPYRYQWSDGENHAGMNDFYAGTYAVTVSDANGCERVLQNLTLTQPTRIIATLNYIRDVSCKGKANGSIGQHISGGTPPYTYRWSHGADTEDLEKLYAGTYSYTVTDANGCTFIRTYVVKEPEELRIDIDRIVPPSCSGASDGLISVNVLGGTAGYFFSWNTGTMGTGISTLRNLPAGTYYLYVRDAQGCVTEKVIQLSQPDPIIIKNATINPESCNGINDGSITLTIEGGSGQKNFRWNDGSSANPRTNLKQGTYSVTITDEKGCSLVKSFIIPEKSPITRIINGISHVTCYGLSNGVIVQNIIGGNPPYRYRWSNGDTLEDPADLTAGNYQMTATDSRGCSAVFDYVITQPQPLSVRALSIFPPRCAGQSNGRINLSVTGGTPPYTYYWDNGNRTANPLNLKGGVNAVVIKDAKGCLIIERFTVPEPTPITATVIEKQDVSCGNDTKGKIQVAVSGGTQPYQYRWSNGQTSATLSNVPAGNYYLVVTDQMGCTKLFTYKINGSPLIRITERYIQPANCINPNSGVLALTVTGGTPPLRFIWSNGNTSEDLGQIPAGNYQLTVTDAKGCTYTESFIVPSESNLRVANAIINPISCHHPNSGSISLIIQNGKPPYQYLWIKDNVIQPIQTASASNLSAGAYRIVITDANGCRITYETVLTSPALLTLNVLEFHPPNCDNPYGSIKVNGSGGSSPYQYSWSNGKMSANLDSLTGGSYTLTIRDANGCRKDTTFLLDYHSFIQAQIFSIVQPTCEIGGKITLSIEGGINPLTFLWSNGATVQNPVNLPAGTYAVTITDRNGCLKSISNIQLTAPDGNMQITLLRLQNPRCYLPNGSLVVSVIGGVSPYRYQWSNGWNTPSNGGLVAGNYTVTVTDSKGCQKIQTFTLTNPNPPLVIFDTEYTPITCSGGNNGAIRPYVSGGEAPYQFAWSTGARTPILQGLRTGYYSVTITDALGCRSIERYHLTEPSPLVLTLFDRQNPSCPTCNDGVIQVRATGGTAPYSYQLENIATNQTGNFSGLVSNANYRIVVTDAKGCRNSLNVALVAEQTCETPRQPSANPSVNDALVYWGVVGGASSYILSWRVLPNGSWQQITISGWNQSHRLTGLQASTNYEIRLKAICGEHTSEWSDSKTFRTAARRISDDYESKDLQAYPNPANETLNLTANYPFNVNIFDVSGKKMGAWSAQNGVINLPTAEWNAGVYLVEVQSATGSRHSFKLVVIH